MIPYQQEPYIERVIANISFLYTADCEWSDFGEWSNCSVDCGNGEQERTRKIEKAAAFGGNNCTGLGKETRACKIKECPGIVNTILIRLTIFHPKEFFHFYDTYTY